MDGVHDLGGVEGFGPVEVEADEPSFHAAWEGRVHGMMLTLAVQGKVRNFRYAIERMDPVHYLASPYYEHWLEALERMLREGGEVTDAELRSTQPGPAETHAATRGDPQLAARVAALLRPFPVSPPDRFTAAFAPGDRVRVRRVVAARHTRCPRYVRGQPGTVMRVHPPTPLHDALVEGERRPEPYYSVVFNSRDLWGHDDDEWDVIVDLWESYLDERKDEDVDQEDKDEEKADT